MHRQSLPLALVLAFAPAAFGQVTFNVTYQDVGFGFNDAAQGAARRQVVTDVAAYLGTVLDGRGTTNLQWNTSTNNAASGNLGSFGSGFVGFPGTGTFVNGSVHSNLRTSASPNAAPDGSGQINFGHTWHTGSAGTLPGGSFDLYSVVLHEFTHGLGFASLAKQDGTGAFGAEVINQPGTYGGFDRYLQLGPGAGTPLFDTNKASANYGRFLGTYGAGAAVGPTVVGGPAPAFTSDNLYFNGQYATEANGGAAVKLHAPAAYSEGSSVSHVDFSLNSVMNPGIASGVAKRTFSNREIGMLIDLGYNQYNWNATTGNWSAGSASVNGSRWTSELGVSLVNTSSGLQEFNTNADPAEAPILAPYGQSTSNIVLNFRGAAAYTSTNDIGDFRIARLNHSNTQATTIAGGTFLWGQDAGGAQSVLAPRVVQNGAGALTISGAQQLFTRTDGNAGLTVNGTGAGQVTFSGALSGTGGLTKQGSFRLNLTNNNSYAGNTLVSAGTLAVNNGNTALSGTGSGDVTVQSGARLEGAGGIGGLATLDNGSVLAPGNSAGTLTFNGGLDLAGTYQWELGALSTATGFDRLVVNESLFLSNLSNLALDFNLLAPALRPDAGALDSFWQDDETWKIIDWVGPGNPNQNFLPANLLNGSFASGMFSTFVGSGADTGDVFLRFTAVPEPSSLLLLGAALGFAAFRRRAA